MRTLFFSLFLVISLVGFSQNDPYENFQSAFKKLETIASMSDENMLNTSWEVFLQTNPIPITQVDSVLFVYKGKGNSVLWQGDFNFWGRVDSVQNKGTRIGTTDFWYWKAQFPTDARLDYQVVVDGKWMLDPLNPQQQWAGVNNGVPNSTFHMPGYQPSSYLMKRREPKGTWEEKIFESVFLPYDIKVDVFLPEKAKGPLPVLYLTDGQEYKHEKMGNLPVVADNLTQERRMSPVVLVFIDMRDPDNLNENRRVSQLPLNPAYAQFIIRELVPWIEINFKTSRKSEDRAILGTSLGGLHAAYMAHAFPDFFGKVAMQSPAFWFNEEIYPLVADQQLKTTRFFMTTGTIYDTEKDARKMKSILEEKGYPLTYVELNQGHSWGNWASQLENILVEFFPGSKK
jgi:enterochelin esterase-like enzyme